MTIHPTKHISGTVGEVMGIDKNASEIKGGSCAICGYKYKERRIENYFRQGVTRVLYVPVCDCAEKAKLKQEGEKKADVRMIEGEFPETYLDYTFANFPGDRDLWRQAAEYANKKKPGIMLLVGKIGAGKTSLAVATCRKLAARGSVLYAYAYDVLTAGVQVDQRLAEIRRLDKIKTLVIDEIGLQISTDSARDFMERLLIGRNDYGLNTILISNQEAQDFERSVGQRAWDRAIKQGQVVPFKGRNLRGE